MGPLEAFAPHGVSVSGKFFRRQRFSTQELLRPTHHHKSKGYLMNEATKQNETDLRLRTQTEVAAFFNVHRHPDWVSIGMPGKPKNYSLRAICQWIATQRRNVNW